MRKLTLVLLVSLLIFSVALMGENLKVGFIATNFSAESQARVARSFKAEANELGWKVVQLNSMGTINKQADQMNNLVQMDVDAIVLAMAHPHEISPALERALDNDIPVITVDSGYYEGVVADITANNFVMGAKVSTYLVNQLGGEGNIVTVKFNKHFGTRRRGKVLDIVLSEYRNVEVIAEHTMSSPKKFMENTRNAMSTFVTKYGDKIDGVWCAFDQLAYAASDVLEQHGIDAKVVGIDGNDETMRRIKNGVMTATVKQPFENMGKKAVELIDKIVNKGMSYDEATGNKDIIYLDAPLIDASDLD